jgi:DNA-binding CsgD family transcriptional regulator
MKEEVKKIISTRELKILELVAKGYTSERIGEMLAIAKTTVQTHRRNMLRKTGISNTQELVGWGYRNQLLR